MVGAFFVPAMRYGGRARETLGSAGVLCGRFANLRTAAPITVWRQRERLQHKGASTMVIQTTASPRSPDLPTPYGGYPDPPSLDCRARIACDCSEVLS